MVLAVWYWLFMALAVLSGVWLHWPGESRPAYLVWGNSVLFFLLFLVLGIAVFGSPVK